MFSFRPVITATVVAALVCLVACEEEDTRLVDETGVWTLEKYSLMGEPYQDVAQVRKGTFMLRFNSTDHVVAAAGCHEDGTDLDILSSNCLNAGSSTWSCQCFAYTYEMSTMVWQEFPPGEPPPAVGTPDAGGDTGGTDGTGAHRVDLSSFGGSTTTYEFSSLPMDLFNSDGMLSKHVFQLKADTVWTGADVNMDGTPDLDACAASCFPSESGG